MRSFRNIFLVVLMAVAFVGAGPIGCSTTQGGANRIESAAYVASYVGTAELVASHPDWRDDFEQAARELAVLEAGPVDAIALMGIISRLPVKELKSDRAVLYITAATILLTDEIGTTPIEKLDNLRPVISAIRKGIERGLALGQRTGQ